MFQNEIWNWQIITASLMVRYFLNLLVMVVLIRLIYYRIYRKSNLIPAFFAFNSIIFFVSYMLNMVEMTTGAAFGLFAVFSILRFRTDGISSRDMTYLFISIAIGLLSSVSKGRLTEVGCINLILLVLAFVMENRHFIKRESSKQIYYDNISNIKPEQHQQLIEELKVKTGLDIRRILINDIDFVKETCSITLFYSEERR